MSCFHVTHPPIIEHGVIMQCSNGPYLAYTISIEPESLYKIWTIYLSNTRDRFAVRTRIHHNFMNKHLVYHCRFSYRGAIKMYINIAYHVMYCMLCWTTGELNKLKHQCIIKESYFQKLNQTPTIITRILLIRTVLYVSSPKKKPPYFVLTCR